MATNWGGIEEQELDKRNQQRAFNLSNKVSQLRSLAVDIEGEALDQNRLLDGVDSDFGAGDTLLGGSRNRLEGVLNAGKQNRKLMCYVALGVVFVVFILYLMSSKAAS